MSSFPVAANGFQHYKVEDNVLQHYPTCWATQDSSIEQKIKHCILYFKVDANDRNWKCHVESLFFKFYLELNSLILAF